VLHREVREVEADQHLPEDVDGELELVEVLVVDFREREDLVDVAVGVDDAGLAPVVL
jgi:hypothetical protein